jgi:hypothetical protein
MTPSEERVLPERRQVQLGYEECGHKSTDWPGLERLGSSLRLSVIARRRRWQDNK